MEEKVYRVFVYGSLRRGEFNHKRFQGFADGFKCAGHIFGAILKPLGSYPCIIPGGPEDKVEGEIYDLPESLHKVILRMEEGAGYELRPVSVKVQISEEVPDKYDDIQASAYFFRNPGRIEDIAPIAHGDWTKREGNFAERY